MLILAIGLINCDRLFYATPDTEWVAVDFTSSFTPTGNVELIKPSIMS